MKNHTPYGRIVLACVLCGFLSLAAGSQPARAQDEPTIAKDSVRITLMSGVERRGYSYRGWRPYFEYRVNGPIPSGAQLSVELSEPTHKNWLKFDCGTGETEAGRWWEAECGGESVPDEKATIYTGMVSFSIRLRNELSGTNATLFSGKFKVGTLPLVKGADPEFYVDEDWRIPIGYVFYEEDTGHRATFLNVGFWIRGNPATVEAHLFYQGKEIAKFDRAGNEGRDWHPENYQWGFYKCPFIGVYKDDPGEEGGYDPRFAVSKNPGEYEVKALVGHHLARSIKFTVNADGSFDNGIASANKLGSNRVIVPVQVIGNQGPWDRTAWKTGAFYGNPLTGFTALP